MHFFFFSNLHYLGFCGQGTCAFIRYFHNMFCYQCIVFQSFSLNKFKKEKNLFPSSHDYNFPIWWGDMSWGALKEGVVHQADNDLYEVPRHFHANGALIVQFSDSWDYGIALSFEISSKSLSNKDIWQFKVSEIKIYLVLVRLTYKGGYPPNCQTGECNTPQAWDPNESVI